MTAAALLRWLGWRGVVAVLALIAMTFCAWRWNANADTVSRLKAEALQWEQANRDNVKAIDALRDANKAWSTLADKRKAAAEIAVAAVAAERDRLAAELQSRQSSRRVIIVSDRDAASWGRAVVPAAVADSVRKDHRPN